jgi:hypothetical protein
MNSIHGSWGGVGRERLRFSCVCVCGEGGVLGSAALHLMAALMVSRTARARPPLPRRQCPPPCRLPRS